MILIIYLVGAILSFGRINAIENSWIGNGFGTKNWTFIAIFCAMSWIGLVSSSFGNMLVIGAPKSKLFDFKLKP